MSNFYTSEQSVEIINGGGRGYHETTFLITLICTAAGSPGQYYGPPENCYEGWDAEFEIEEIAIENPEGENPKISYELLEAFVGKDVAKQLIEESEQDAIESGEF